MQGKKQTILRYCSLTVGVVCAVLLKIFDKSSIVSMLLVIAELTAFVWNIRHVQTKRQYLVLAIVFVVAYTIRAFGFTKTAIDYLIGLLSGIIMLAVLSVELIFKKHKAHPLYCLAFPIAFYAFMLVADYLKINIAFRLDSYFSSITVMMQIAALLGTYFIDFLIVLTASAVAFVIDNGFAKKAILVTAVYVFIISAVFTFGTVRLGKKAAETKKDTLIVACTTGPYYGDFLEAMDAECTFEQMIESLDKTVSAAVSDDADIIMFSEEAFYLKDYQEDELLDYASELARKNKIHIVLPYEVEDTDNSQNGKSVNQLCWIDDKGEIIYEYVKHSLIPFLEDFLYVKGTQAANSFNIDVDGREIKVAAVICYDVDFDLYMQKAARDIDVLFVPCWDWQVIANQQLNIARLEAVSLNTTVVRSTYDGWSAVIDGTGNMLAGAHSNDTGYEQVITYEVPIYDK